MNNDQEDPMSWYTFVFAQVISGLQGFNVAQRSTKPKWYSKSHQSKKIQILLSKDNWSSINVTVACQHLPHDLLAFPNQTITCGE